MTARFVLCNKIIPARSGRWVADCRVGVNGSEISKSHAVLIFLRAVRYAGPGGPWPEAATSRPRCDLEWLLIQRRRMISSSERNQVMARIPRRQMIDEHVPGLYHVYSRTVRRTFLFGQDAVTGRDYAYRLEMLLEAVRTLSQLAKACRPNAKRGCDL